MTVVGVLRGLPGVASQNALAVLSSVVERRSPAVPAGWHGTRLCLSLLSGLYSQRSSLLFTQLSDLLVVLQQTHHALVVSQAVNVLLDVNHCDTQCVLWSDDGWHYNDWGDTE